jgi:LiaI-LiaF-like transmembrane region
MNCYQHSDLPAVAFCRACGRGLCTSCQRIAEGTVFCQEHAPVTYSSAPRPDAGPNPYFQQTSGFSQPSGVAQPGFGSGPLPPGAVQTSPGLAFLLGLIPGVGAIYNGQYLKGFIHVAILGVLISMVSSGHFSGEFAPFLGLLIAIWYFYMPFEAFHTARKRQLGIVVDEWSSLLPRLSAPSRSGRLPLGPVVLIGLGVLFLLDNLGVLPLSDVLRYWPLILIGLGVSSLYSRLSGPLPVVPPPPPPSGPIPPPRSGDPMTSDAVGGAR